METRQEWGSNQIHYEGNLLTFWKKPLSIPEQGVTFDNMTPELKEAFKDGLMIYENRKFKDIINVEIQTIMKVHLVLHNKSKGKMVILCYSR